MSTTRSDIDIFLKDTITSPAWKEYSVDYLASMILPFVTVGSSDADYITDGVADDVQIQQAINDVNAAGGGLIWIKEGTYNIASQITLPFNPYIRLTGEKFAKGSTGGTILKSSATLTNMFYMAGNTNPATNADLSHDFEVENITINGNNKTTNLFYLSNQDSFRLKNCRLVGGTNSIKTVWDSNIDPDASTIPGAIFADNCIISGRAGGIAIDFQYQTQCWFSNCWFSGDGTVATWLNFNASNNINFVNCQFNSCATSCFAFSDTASFSCQNITILGFTAPIGTGIKLISDTRSNSSSKKLVIIGTTTSTANSDTVFGSENVIITGTKSDVIQIAGIGLTADSTARLFIATNDTAKKGLVIRNFTGQTARSLEIQGPSGSVESFFNNIGNLFLPDGTSSIAAFSFAQDIDTGFYRPGSNKMQFLAGGVEILTTTSAGVGINNTSPDASAVLDVASTTQGFLPPRMTTAQRDAISSPAAGLIIYNTTTNKLNVYTTTWEQITSV